MNIGCIHSQVGKLTGLGYMHAMPQSAAFDVEVVTRVRLSLLRTESNKTRMSTKYSWVRQTHRAGFSTRYQVNVAYSDGRGRVQARVQRLAHRAGGYGPSVLCVVHGVCALTTAMGMLRAGRGGGWVLRVTRPSAKVGPYLLTADRPVEGR